MARKAATNRFDQLNDRLITQLDSLVPFLALSHREIFAVLKRKYPSWYIGDRRTTLPHTFTEYGHQVAHAAFLLGYSYVEAFVTDLIFEVYSVRRDLLPKEKQLPFGEVLKLSDLDAVFRHMIASYVGDMNSLEAKVLHLKTKLGWKIPQPAHLLEAHVARNALVHNAGHVNREPAECSRWHSGSRIKLSASDVHDFGLFARGFARDLCMRAKAICTLNSRRTRRKAWNSVTP